MTNNRTMYYGKGDVLVYRTYAKPLRVKPIPESSFAGNENAIFALNVKIAVRGDAFLPSFTEADNTMVVATDSMKNFILRHAADFKGSTVESFLYFIACKFLDRYPQMTGVHLIADRIPFDGVQVSQTGGTFAESGLVYRRSHNDHGTFEVDVERAPEGNIVRSLRGTISDLQLIKLKGSSFAGFVRDEYTTLPETSDRPLFIFLNINWTYENAENALDAGGDMYVAAEQIRDIAQTVFHELSSASIQSLIYHIGLRILERFPQLAEVSFESNNRTWETVMSQAPDEEAAVYTESRPPYGFQGFSMTQRDLAGAAAKGEAAATRLS
ncbi:factor-independent urate hydroxylase [Paenibacillus hamazuiensis]|uniref:factor-independent urate hydroxylase n=1 Tax=Paenibacillus hamazuiensis TaxID=2936508 RepID=UPI00200CD5FD|nr:urate oxidase [Paenibacillus hamazuiensis]